MIEQTRAQVIDQFRGLLSTIDAAIEDWKAPGIIRGSDHVIRTSPGLYLTKDASGTWTPVDILRASIWSRETASVVAFNVTDQAGNRGRSVHYLDALRQERDELSDLIGRLEAI